MQKFLHHTTGGLSALALFAIMALTFFDVGGRKLFEHSIPGSFELTELLMVVVIFAALPLVSAHGEHVVFDSLDAYLPKALQRWQRVLVHVLCAAALLGLSWLMWQSGLQFAASGETTAQLKLSKAPFVCGMGVLCGLTGLVHAVLAYQTASTELADADKDGVQSPGVAL
jgi:TRAP-type transport system small permease protein